MNRNKLNLVVCATTLLLPVSYCTGQSNTVYYGVNSNALAVVFVDTNLSTSVKSNIVVDLNICLREWGKESELRLWEDEDTAGYLYNWKSCPHYPDGIDFPDDIVSNGASGVALRIPKELSDAYTNAFAFAATNSNTVAAAYEFVRFVSSTNFHTITVNQITNYVLFNKAPPRLYEMEFHSLTNDLSHQTYYPPSALGIHYREEGPAKSNLWMFVPCTSVDEGGGLNWSPLPALWHGGRWKFCIWEDEPHYNLPEEE